MAAANLHGTSVSRTTGSRTAQVPYDLSAEERSTPKGRNAVLIVGFNRPEMTRRLIERVKCLYNPRILYLAVDGARETVPGEIAKVDQVRQLVQVCGSETEIRTLFHDRNVGCARGVPAGVSWMLEEEEQGIVLEDDIVVSRAFFQYMDWCLEHFKDDNRVLHISGFQPFGEKLSGSYPEILINTHPYVWGWGTWRRAWDVFDEATVYEPRGTIVRWMSNSTKNRRSLMYYTLAARMTAQEKVKAWDFRWVLSIARMNGLCLVPRQSLVQNVGFGANASHTARAPHLEDVMIGEIDWDNKALIGRMDERTEEELHLISTQAASNWKLMRMLIAALLPMALYKIVWKLYRRELLRRGKRT